MRLEEMFWLSPLAPERLSVTLKVCGPVPAGGWIPVVETVICHCVPEGEITLQLFPATLHQRVSEKVPFLSATVGWKPTITCGWPFTVIVGLAVLGTICACTVAKE